MLKHWLAQSIQAGYLTVGMLALLLGLIGIVTPLLPTTPLMYTELRAYSDPEAFHE